MSIDTQVAAAATAADLSAYRTWSRRRVIVALAVGIPCMAALCVVVQWPLWTSGKVGLAAANLVVSLAFYATSVFVYGEPRQRLTGVALAAAALLWPLNWVNEWRVGPLPLIAALEGPLYGLLAVWALLRYPSPWRRVHDAIAFAAVILIQLVACLQVVTSLPEWHGLPAGTTWLAWWPDRHAYVLTQNIYNYGIIAVAAVAVLALTVRMARLTGPDRRIMRPVLVAIVVSGIATAGSGLAIALGSSAVDELSALEAVVLVSVPLTFMAAAARRWLAREWVPKLIRRLASCPTSASVQCALRDILDDPALRLLYRVGNDYVDVDGTLAAGVPWDDPDVTVIAAQPSAAYVILLTANLVLARYRDTVYAAARAAMLAMENTSLQASIRANIRLVAQSAERLAAAVDAERRSVQRVAAHLCAVELAALAEQLESAGESGGAAEFPTELATAQELLARTELDLTRLSEGLDPAELTRLGFAQLITAAAQRLNREIVVTVPDEPMAAGVQAAAYFILCELMTNTVKHAPRAAVTVSAAYDGPELILEVSDDGPGGADPAGSGLSGLRERAAELSGTLTIASAPSLGTTVVVRLPDAASGEPLNMNRVGTDSE